MRKVPQKYPTIQAAVDAANPGDSIEISKKKNFEHVTVSTPRLVIKGVKPGVVVDGYLEAIGHGNQFDISANRVRVANLELRHGYGIDCNASERCVAERVRFTGQSHDDCFYSGGDRAQVLRSTLTACGDNGVHMNGNKGRIVGNTIRLADSQCVYVNADDVVVRNNVVRNCEDGDGISVTGDNARIVGNRIANVDGDLIDVSGTGGKVLRNRASAAYGDCFYLYGDRSRAEGNRGSDCDEGLYISGSNVKAIGNRLSGMDSTAMYVGCSGACSKAVVQDNIVRNAFDDGYGLEVYVASVEIATR